VSDALERFRFNKAVAQIRELTNALEDFDVGDPAAPALFREALEVTARLLAPMTPHLAEELWERLGHAGLIADAAWPAADPAWLAAGTITVAVQVNGKRRAELALPAGADEAAAREAALALENVQRAMGGKPARKVIVVPDRIVNVVV
jgi:leucyl-tRNA synthetase